MKRIAVLSGLFGLAIAAAGCTPTTTGPHSVTTVAPSPVATPPATTPPATPPAGPTVAYVCPDQPAYSFTITILSSSQRRVTGIPVGDQIFTAMTTAGNAGQYESGPYRIQYSGEDAIALWDGGVSVTCYPA